MTKVYISHCLLRLVKCSLSGKYLLTFSVAASSSASGPLSKGHVTSIIRTFLSSSMTISGRRGRPESATARSVVTFPKRTALVIRVTNLLWRWRMCTRSGRQWLRM